MRERRQTPTRLRSSNSPGTRCFIICSRRISATKSSKKYELWEPRSVYNDVWWRDKVFLENILTERPVRVASEQASSITTMLLISSANRRSRRTGAGHADERRHALEVGPPCIHLICCIRSGAPERCTRFSASARSEQGGTIDTVHAMGVGHGPAMRFVSDLVEFRQFADGNYHGRIRPGCEPSLSRPIPRMVRRPRNRGAVQRGGRGKVARAPANSGARRWERAARGVSRRPRSTLSWAKGSA